MSSLWQFVPGKVLIANSVLNDGHFFRSVVLMVEHNRDGAFGLILNKRSEHRISTIVADVPDQAMHQEIYIGGPVGQNYVFILHQVAASPFRGEEILPGTFLGSSQELLQEVFHSSMPFKVFYGYSGWGAGQLESELKTHSWQITSLKSENIFHSPDHTLWRQALLLSGGISSFFAAKVKNPALN